MFSAADAYERFMGRWSRQLAVPFVQFAGVQADDTVLDVGCGTGAVADAVATLSPATRIAGIDLSPAFVAYAQAHRSTNAIQFDVGDAQQLPFRDRSFTRTLSLLNLNFIPDPAKAIREMVRVTRPGGTVAAAVWDYGRGMEMLRTFWDEAVSMNADADAKDERHMPLSREGELATLFQDHGLDHVDASALTIQTRFASLDDYWRPFLERQGPAGAWAAALPDDERDQLRERLRRRLLGEGADGPLVLRARAWAVRGGVGS